MKNMFVLRCCELIDSTSEGNNIGVVWKWQLVLFPGCVVMD